MPAAVRKPQCMVVHKPYAAACKALRSSPFAMLRAAQHQHTILLQGLRLPPVGAGPRLAPGGLVLPCASAHMFRLLMRLPLLMRRCCCCGCCWMFFSDFAGLCFQTAILNATTVNHAWC